MAGFVVVVTGVGTEVGKTHLACTLLTAARLRGLRVAGYKPVESGVGAGPSDQGRLDAASFHVKQPPLPRPRLALHTAVSPHLAARLEGTAMDLRPLLDWAAHARGELDGLLVELAGGLFSPVSEATRNIDLLAHLAPAQTILVAPDALGVLHDVEAVRRAAPEVHFTAVVLVTPERPDASTGTNAAELLRLGSPAPLFVLPRGTPEDLAPRPVVADLLRRLGW